MNRITLASLALASLFAAAGTANAALTQSQIWAGVPLVYNNGAGSGFGGAINNPASLTFSISSGNLVVTASPNFGIDNNIALWLDTRAGGLTDAQMSDVGDPGRGVLSSPVRNSNLNFPGAGATADNTILPEYGVAFFGGGAASFELTTGSHNFLTFVPNGPGNTRTISIPLASLGSPDVINFFAGYISDSGYASNESIPASSLQNTGNPGFGDQQFGGAATPVGGFGINNYNQFVIAIPEPSALSLLGLPALALTRRARRN